VAPKLIPEYLLWALLIVLLFRLPWGSRGRRQAMAWGNECPERLPWLFLCWFYSHVWLWIQGLSWCPVLGICKDWAELGFDRRAR